MKASRIHAFGGPEAIAIEEIAMPEPGPGEVLVQVHAAGVGPWDSWIRTGKSVLPQPLPLTLGSDFSGVITGLGEGVTGFATGDEVYGVTNSRFTGACAEYAVASAGMISAKPRSITHREAASVPVVATTAWQMLFEQAGLSSGQCVLVLGGAGNVGGYAVQFAHRKGVHVVATGFADRLDELRRLGADETMAADAAQADDRKASFDAVIDTIGGEWQVRSMQMLKPGGVLVSAVSAPDADAAEALGIRALFFLVRVNTSTLAEIAAIIDHAALKPRLGLVLPMAGMVRAHEFLDGIRKPSPPGKIVIDVLATSP
ncbi:NADP-dependent oxidoreductase [Rhodanobacter spathiphylli]|uniref:Putative quinone oxidoreductase n=1 Tax=Rhodanobacter spathiphylli B39 TaxID=1163407 RepID=I4W4Y5_9GAMM|nr:NADP-dependent oxidoreductase [Rhodanobacter spathiphylli]EIL94526.1 putative quinone oxidoreductase [Rhodanobacter spathiphylli B39]